MSPVSTMISLSQEDNPLLSESGVVFASSVK
jgi:hypothetical protein